MKKLHRTKAELTLSLLILMAYVDQHYHPAEKNLINKFGKKEGLNNSQIKKIEDTIPKQKKNIYKKYEDLTSSLKQSEKEISLKLLLIMALVDDDYSQDEKELISSIGKKEGIKKNEILKIEKETQQSKKNFYEQCKELSKSLKGTEAVSMIKLLTLMAITDKEYHEKEKKIVEKIAKKEGISNNEILKIENDVKKSKENFYDQCKSCTELIKDKSIRISTLKNLAKLAAVDAIIHEDEMLLLQIVSEEWGMFLPSLKKLTNKKGIIK